MTTTGHINRMAYTTTTWRECVIWCACEGGGWRECVAQVYGVFGLHHTVVEEEDYAYDTLTHIPTGKALMCGATGEEREQLVALAERLTALGDWNTRAGGKLKALKEAM